MTTNPIFITWPPPRPTAKDTIRSIRAHLFFLMHNGHNVEAVLAHTVATTDLRQGFKEWQARDNEERQKREDAYYESRPDVECFFCLAALNKRSHKEVRFKPACDGCRAMWVKTNTLTCAICAVPFLSPKTCEIHEMFDSPIERRAALLLAAPPYPDLCEGHNTKKIAHEFKRIKAQNKRTTAEGLESSLTLVQWLALIDLTDSKCVYCGDPFNCIEHVQAVADGGGTTALNCVPACSACNLKKRANGERHIARLFGSGAVRRLRNLREAMKTSATASVKGVP